MAYAQLCAANPDQPVYTENQRNISVVSKQPQFTIKLKSNPTTGYSWFLRDYDANLIQPIKHIFQKAETTLIGAPGYELWTFQVKNKGFIVPHQTTIRFNYARPWQMEQDAKQIIFYVNTR